MKNGQIWLTYKVKWFWMQSGGQIGAHRGINGEAERMTVVNSLTTAKVKDVLNGLTPGSLRKTFITSFSSTHICPTEVLWSATKIAFQNKQLPKGHESLKASRIITYLINCPASCPSADIWYVWSLHSFVAELWGSHLPPLTLTLPPAWFGVCLFFFYIRVPRWACHHMPPENVAPTQQLAHKKLPPPPPPPLHSSPPLLNVHDGYIPHVNMWMPDQAEV